MVRADRLECDAAALDGGRQQGNERRHPRRGDAYMRWQVVQSRSRAEHHQGESMERSAFEGTGRRSKALFDAVNVLQQPTPMMVVRS